jgi:xeroderma pigmentosum group C-complementing protein
VGDISSTAEATKAIPWPMDRGPSSATPAKRNYGVALAQDSDSESDSDWENVGLNEKPSALELAPDEAEISNGVTIELDRLADQDRRHTRHATTALARRIRLDTHKAHLLCMLAHNATRNSWCRHERVRAALKPIVDNFHGKLHPKASSSQYQRTRILTEGLAAAATYWHKLFKVVGSGLGRPKWCSEGDTLHQKMIPPTGRDFNFTDFVKAARDMRGSRDLGAQLLVAFLHCQGLDVRLVCSLQVLGSVLGKGSTDSSIGLDDLTTAAAQPSSTPSPPKVIPPAVAMVGRRLTRPAFGIAPPRPPDPLSVVAVPQHTDPSDGSPYPIYWAEVFDTAAQKWLSVDAMCTKTVGKPTKLEPPASDHNNLLSYVVGFEADGAARDVTQRYATLFNAKTLKHRVDSREQGARWWWNQVMPLYRLPRRHPGRAAKRDREAIENAQFQAARLKEPVPSAVQDFKRHPLFVLERDLRRDEVLDLDARECGQVIVGKARPPVMERVFPRKAVLHVRSQQQWYQRGRVVRPLEIPRKFRKVSIWEMQARKRRRHGQDDDDGENENSAILDDVPLFTEGQTDAYCPAPVIVDDTGRSLVPRNQFGNVDLYCTSMLPVGSMHLSCDVMRILAKAEHPSHVLLTWTGAQLTRYLIELIQDTLDVDAAPAVIGFKHGRGGGGQAAAQPIMDGVVVPLVYQEALEIAVLAGLDYIQRIAEDAKSVAVLKRWANWLQRLRIKNHVETQYAETETIGPGGFMKEEAKDDNASETYSFEYESD